MRVVNYFVKGLLRYVCVKGKAHDLKSIFASTSRWSKRLLSLDRTVSQALRDTTVDYGEW